MRISLPLFFIIAFIAATTVGCRPPVLPQPNDSIDSKILREKRDLQVLLPKDYATGSPQRYDVVYVLDGEWYTELVPNAYRFAQSAGYIPATIFVVIPNRYLNGRNLRDRDFSPTKTTDNALSGGADLFYAFLTREVVPYVEKKYPTNGRRSLVGSSFSGLFTVYAFLKDPLFFQSYVASDPNLNWDHNTVYALATRSLPSCSASYGSLFIAGVAQTYQEMGTQGFDSVLRADAPKSLHWTCISYPDETHYSVQWKAFYDGARFSYPGYTAQPPEYYSRSHMQP